jgi:molybdenum cofactor guanylyltransferase
MPEKLEHDITGLILVGGKSSRMGRDKALLPVAGKPILERLLEVFQGIFPGVILAGNQGERFARYGLPFFPDIYPGSALGGIYTGLHHAETPYLFVSSCDIPFPNPEVIRNLCCRRKGADVVVVRTPNGCEPLFALYSRQCLGPIRDLLESGDCCAYGYYPKVRVRYVPYKEIARLDRDGRALVNVNTPEEFQQIGGVPWK